MKILITFFCASYSNLSVPTTACYIRPHGIVDILHFVYFEKKRNYEAVKVQASQRDISNRMSEQNIVTVPL